MPKTSIWPRSPREVGTPFYCYSTATLERHYRVFADAVPKDSLIAFSVKANGNLAVSEDTRAIWARAPTSSRAAN